MSKFTNDEKSLVKNIIASLTIKRIEDNDIIKVIKDQTGKSLTRKEIWNIRERIKRESYHWYKTMREGEYEYYPRVQRKNKRNNVFAKEASSNCNEKRRQSTDSTNIISRIAPTIYNTYQIFTT